MNEPSKAAGDPVKFRTDSTGKVVEFWIDRSRWARKDQLGLNTNGVSQLLNPEGGMCCLGFYARACGVSPDKILNMGSPPSIPNVPSQMGWLIRNDHLDSSSIAISLITANDQQGYSLKPKEQEKKIRDLFAKQDIKVRIVK